MHRKHLATSAVIGCLLTVLCTARPADAAQSAWVKRGVTGRLLYTPDAQGDRIPDFSDVGYRGGKAPIPDVPTAVMVSPTAGDDTASVQAAIDQVAALPIGPDGFRGAVELSAGTFEIGGTLEIRDSGVVLRGAGRDAGGTLLQATGAGQRDLIQIFGSGSQSLTGSTSNMLEKTVPVGSRSFRVDSTSGFSVGDTVRVERPSTANWISDLGMDMIPPRDDGQPITQWQAGSFDLRYDRVITRIEGDRIFVDAPLVNSFEQQYGGGTIRRYTWADRIENVGVENLRAESDFTSATDEDHAWNFVSIDSAQHVWVRNTLSAHFGRSAVLSNPGSKWVTVDNAINEEPISQITGSRRYTFDFSGELELVTNSEANDGRHDFVNNSTRPAGPHVFHNSVANNALNDSGPHQRWATGSLFDNITVDGDEINARNRGNFGSGHGWAGANMVIWNSTADGFIVQNPPTAQNWLVGSTGTVIDDQTFGPQPPGYIDSHGTPVDVDSLYDSQVADAADVTEFHWDAVAGDWSDAELWRERLAPGAYRVETRDYLIGDIDDFTDDGAGSVDDAFVDPDWEAYILGSSSHPVTGFDNTTQNQNVAFTIEHALDADERVVHGSLALSLKQTGGMVDTDFVRLFDTDSTHRLFFSDLGWDTQINQDEAFVGLIDLGEYTDELQSGSVNVQLNDDTAVDWALYTVTVAEPTTSPTPVSVTIANGGVATIGSGVGSVGSLTVGGAAPGTLSIENSGSLSVSEDYTQSLLGSLQVEVSGGGAGFLDVQGDASLAGEFELAMDPEYTAEVGDFFTLVSVSGQLSGAFDQVSLPDLLDDGLRWSLLQTSNVVVAFVGLAGDFNSDGVVDGVDFTIWRENLGSTTSLAADADGDGMVTVADYDVWAANLGRTAGDSDALSAPEPDSLLLIALCTLLAAVASSRTARAQPIRSTAILHHGDSIQRV